MYIGVHLFYLGGVGGRRITVTDDDDRVPFRCAEESRVMDGELPVVERPSPTGPPASESIPTIR